ncbi:hypothetical protein V5O48_007678 [Marasmius crinis-equi]|uniref:Cytochrome P450 n=1 Tax=Marasmius crinis-equi TaxID=585013 RepID=A0ABR3FG54_9AGAR
MAESTVWQMLPQISTIGVLFAVAAWVVSKLLNIGRREGYLPPGPATVPILGNLHVFPTEYPQHKFTEWARQYGDIYSLKVGPSTAIVITGIEAVKELMEKRSGSTVDRPQNHMVDKVTDGLNLALGRYSEKWRALRKTAHAILTPKAVANHLPIQRAEATQALYDILKDPKAGSSRYSSRLDD